MFSERFDAERTGKNFSGYALHILRQRVIDWDRKRLGRTKWQFKDKTYERPRPQLVSLDADDSLRDRLESSVARSGLDDDAHRLADELRTLDKRSRRPGRREDWLGDEAA